jgi:D-arabinose 1-dehydrogenase-like Zn-dependent alcohol dehydrogenase
MFLKSSHDGGDREYRLVPVDALARMPESLDATEAAPLRCAAITTEGFFLLEVP